MNSFIIRHSTTHILSVLRGLVIANADTGPQRQGFERALVAVAVSLDTCQQPEARQELLLENQENTEIGTRR